MSKGNSALAKAQKKLRNLIEATGGRHSIQREAVLEAIYLQDKPVTIDAMRDIIGVIHSVERATVYNACKYLVDAGLIAKRGATKGKGDTKPQTLYEGALGDDITPNGICNTCNKVVKVNQEHVQSLRRSISAMGWLLPKHSMNFAVDCIEFEKHGKCKYKPD